MRFQVLTFSLALVFIAACTKAPVAPTFHKSGSGNVEGEGNGPNGSDGGKNTVEPETEYPTEISLANTKFKGDESKLQALVKYAGNTSEKLELKADGSAAVLSIPKLAAGKNDALVVELYEGATLKFKATRAGTSIEKSKANSFKIEDCAIHKLPWSGDANEGLCGWTVQDVKN